MKKEVNSVLNSERKSKYFTKQHKEVLNDFVKDSKIENLMKRLTKLDPKHGGYGMGPNVALTTAAGLGFGDVSTALYVSAGLFGTGTAAAMARDAALKNKISNVINKIQNRTVDVDTGYKQLDLATDLGLLSLPKKDPLKEKEEAELKSLLDKSLDTIGFPQGVKLMIKDLENERN